MRTLRTTPPALAFSAAGLSVLALAIGVVAGRSPVLALGAAITIVFVCIAFADLTFGVAVFTTLVFLETLLPAGAALSLLKVIGAILVLSWFAKVATNRAERDQTFFGAHASGTYLLIAFLGWLAISISWSGDSGAALDSLFRYALNVMLFMIVFTAAQSRRQLKWIIGAYLIGVLITAVYGLVARPEHTAGETFRLAGSVGNSNELAAVLVTGIALSLATARSATSAIVRSAAVGIALLAVISQVLTGSRGGLIALAVAIVAAIVFAGRWRAQITTAALLLVLTGVTFFAAFAPQDIRDRLGRIDPAQDNIAEEGRATLWQVGWEIASNNLVTGVGTGNFQSASRDYVLKSGGVARTEEVLDREQGPHNMYLGMIAETGVPGLALFIGVLAFATVCAARAARAFERIGDWKWEIMSRGLFVALVASCVAGFFSSHDIAKWLWVLLALGPAVLTVSRTMPEPGEAEPPQTASRSRSPQPAIAAGAAARPLHRAGA